MARRKQTDKPESGAAWRAGLYMRLSRFGRDYIDVGRYLERWFPDRDVRFIAVNDNIDSENGPYDMLLPVKNVFNELLNREGIPCPGIQAA